RARSIDRTPGTRQRIARIHLEEGDLEKGYAIITELASELDKSGTPQSLLIEEIADVMIKNGNHDLAADYLAPHLEAFPANYRMRYLRAVALEENGDFDKAIEAFLELMTWKVPENESDSLWSSLTPAERDLWE